MLLIAASILAARKLAQYEGTKRVPATSSAIADAVRWAEVQVSGMERSRPDQSRCHEIKCIFREITKDDSGLDGEIEVVRQKPDGSGYETTGGIIKVQAKSGESYIKQDSDTRTYLINGWRPIWARSRTCFRNCPS